MYRNYLKTCWRNMSMNRFFTAINVSGLSLGLTCSILIGLWVRHEYSIDAFHENGDHLFIVTSCEYSGVERNGSYDTPGLLAEELKKVFPEVKYTSGHASWNGYHTFSLGEKKMKLPGNFASNDFFNMFSYSLLAGDPKTALNAPENIAISRRMATNFFGSPELAIGRTIKLDNYRELEVTAVFEDLKDNVSSRFEYLMSWEFFKKRQPWVHDWHNSGPRTFIQLHSHADAAAFASKIRLFIKQYDGEWSENDRLELGLQPFKERYLYGTFDNGHLSGGRIGYVRLFEFVAIFILAIACINFMNLSTARAVKRAKEIGVRKVNGAMRVSLAIQFMLEAFLITLIAVSLALLFVQLFLPQFNLLTGKNLQGPLCDWQFWVGIGGLSLITALLAGSYPALLLSSFKPVTVLRSNVKASASSISFRKALVVFQFALSMVFIVGMIVITRQVDFIQNKNIGYQKDNLLYLSLTGNIATNFDAFKHEALQIPGVASVTKMSQRPIELEGTTGYVEWEGKDPDTKPTFTQVAVGYDFVRTIGASLVDGRDFSEAHTDSAKFLINETALKVIGYDHPIGMPLTFWNIKATIIGVVRDFHFNSLHVPITPLIIRLEKPVSWGYALIRIESGKMNDALVRLEALHEKVNPDFIFAHQFADEEYGYLYVREQLVQRLSKYFAFLAIFISCLGLLGLMVFSTEQRTKELGIRKVLGASLPEIVRLVSVDFIKLMLLALVLSCPVAFYVMRGWLDGFEYHIDLSWWVFVAAAAGAMLVALLTISAQAIRAGLRNPVNSLRSE